MFDTCKTVAACLAAGLLVLACNSDPSIGDVDSSVVVDEPAKDPSNDVSATPPAPGPRPAQPQKPLGPPQQMPGDKTAADYPDLKIETKVAGEGAEIAKGETGKFHYTGYLLDGTQFDSSWLRGQPMEVQIGTTGVIQGWHLGLVGMKAGETRRLRIPAELAYGERGRGNIPANSTLVFDIECVEIVE